MTKEEYSVSKPENGIIEFSIHRPNNSYEMPVSAARSFAKSILEFTGGSE